MIAKTDTTHRLRKGAAVRLSLLQGWLRWSNEHFIDQLPRNKYNWAFFC